MSTIDRVRKILTDKNVDAVMVSDIASMRYISGFTGGTGYLLVTKQRNLLFTDSRYTIAAKMQAPEFEVIDSKNESYPKVMKQFIDEEKINSVGFEDNYFIFSAYQGFAKEWDKVAMVGLGSTLDDLRQIKTAEELEKIKIAEHIGDLAFEGILSYIKPGVSELEVAAKLEYLLKTNGGERTSFDTIIASGVNSAKPHAEPGHKKIERGDFVTMDFGCLYEGYCSDMTRTIVVGKANHKQKEIYQTVLEAQTAVIEMAKPGLAGREYDKIARDIITKAGYGENFGHGLGHSLGLKIHENPRFSPKEEKIFVKDMVVTVEPGIYIDGFGGVRIEDLIHLTENGNENFAHSAKQLIEL